MPHPPTNEAHRISRIVSAPVHDLLIEISRLTKRPLDPVFIKLLRKFAVQCFELGQRDGAPAISEANTVPAPPTSE
jgi:hypothetical protein